jgi:hypothetical protein
MNEAAFDKSFERRTLLSFMSGVVVLDARSAHGSGISYGLLLRHHIIKIDEKF